MSRFTIVFECEHCGRENHQDWVDVWMNILDSTPFLPAEVECFIECDFCHKTNKIEKS